MNGEQHPWLDEYLLVKPGMAKDFKEEWGWLRYRTGNRLFAARVCSRVEHDSICAGKDLLNLKCDPILAELLHREHAEILPGFYSDRRCQSSVDLGSELSPELLQQLCDDSYQPVFEKLTKRLQRKILGGNTK